jgi:hypothetical protein
MQGQSDYTQLKQRRLETFLRFQMPMVKSILDRNSWPFQKYLYIDLNAGCGYNDIAECDGSPVITARAAQELGLPIYGILFERDKAAAKKLDERMNEFRTDDAVWVVLNADHNERLPDLVASFHGGQASKAERSQPQRFGLVYSDPNGAATPFSAYSLFAKRLPKLDALMNVNATVRKRCRGASGSCGFNPEFCKPLDASLKAIQKKHCFITLPAGRSQWTMAALMDYRPKGLPHGWYDILTPDGQDALDKATHTAATMPARASMQMAFAI